MGYEIRVHIGRKTKPCSMDEGKGVYFLRDAKIDLGKIGHESSIGELSSEAGSTWEACQITGNPSPYDKVYWSEQFKINQEKTLETIKKKDENLLLGLGGEERAEEIIEEIANYAEDWEHDIIEDPYGCILMAVPAHEMLEAIEKDQERYIEEFEEPFYKFELLKTVVEAFKKARSYEKGGQHQCDCYCVVSGY